jgi:hypothetical protein
VCSNTATVSAIGSDTFTSATAPAYQPPTTNVRTTGRRVAHTVIRRVASPDDP